MAVRYYYCDGYSLASVNVSMTVGTCSHYSSSYGTGYSYDEDRLILYFTLDSPVDDEIGVRYSYNYHATEDGVTTLDETRYGYATIPAGQTEASVQVVCHTSETTQPTGDR